jgi:hypothetical protein
MLAQYRESLHRRYPPVCPDCAPAVEEEIRRKDSMARSSALRGWLDKTRGKERERRVSGSLQERERAIKHIYIWRIRGVLWVSTAACWMLGYISSVFCVSDTQLLLANVGIDVLGYSIDPRCCRMVHVLPYLTLISVFWNYWDPTFSSVNKARIRGHEVKVEGKGVYIVRALHYLKWKAI